MSVTQQQHNDNVCIVWKEQEIKEPLSFKPVLTKKNRKKRLNLNFAKEKHNKKSSFPKSPLKNNKKMIFGGQIFPGNGIYF